MLFTERIADGIVESILEASEDELDEELRARRSKDPDEVVRRVTAVAEAARFTCQAPLIL